MARTQLKGSQVEDGNIKRPDLNVDTPGSAVTRRILPGRGVRLDSTGVDSGTGDVTIHADGPIPDREISGTSDTPTASDVGLLLRTLNSSAVGITLDGTSFPEEVVSFTVLQEGTGVITFTAAAGNTIIGAGPHQSSGQGAGLLVMYLGADTWWVSGDTASSLPAPLQSIAGLTTSANQGIYTTGSNTYATYTLTSYGRTLGGLADAAALRTSAGLVIGTNVQAYSANLTGWAGLATSAKQDANATLTAIAGLTLANNQSIYVNGSGALAAYDLTVAGRALLDDADAAAQRTTLGLVIGTNVQAYSANLTAWSGLATSAKQDTDAGLTSIAGLTTSAGTSIYTTAADTYATYATSASGRNLSNIGGTSGSMAYLSGTDTWGLVATTAGGRALLNAAGTANTLPYYSASNTVSLASVTAAGLALLDDADASAQRTTLGLVIGTNVQAYSANLTTWAGITFPGGTTTFLRADGTWATPPAGGGGDTLSAGMASMNGQTSIPADRYWYSTGVDTFALGTITSAGRAILDDADATAQRSTLGLVIGTNVQAYSVNLDGWSGLATSAKQDSNAALTSIAGLTTSAGTSIYTTASNTYATYATSASGRALSNVGGTSGSAPYLSGTDTWSLAATTAGGRALWNVAGTANTIPYFSASNVVTLTAISANAVSLLGAADYAAMRTQLGLVIGTNVQAYNANLAGIAGLTFTNGSSFWLNGSGTPAVYSLTAFATTLLDDADAATMRTTLGLAIGTNVQAYSANLTTFAGISFPGGTTDFLRADGTFATPPGGGSSTLSITASEALLAGDLVNLHSSGGNARVRKANATAVGSEANGFVLANVSSSATATVYKPGDIITGLSGLTPDASYWLSTTAGLITTTPPSATGNVVQYIGRALTATTLYFFPHTPITVS